MTFARETAWNPRGIGWLSFFLSVFPAGVLHLINWRRLGYPERSKKTAANLLLLAVIYVTVLVGLGGLAGELTVFIVNVVASYYYSRSQKKAFREFIKSGGKRARFYVPIVVGILMDIALVFLFQQLFVFSVSSYDKRFLEAGAHLNRQEYEQAKEIYRELQKEYPEETTAVIYMSECYRMEHKYDSALLSVERILDSDPSNEAAIGQLGVIIKSRNRRKILISDSKDTGLEFSSLITSVDPESIEYISAVRSKDSVLFWRVVGGNLWIESTDGSLIRFDSLGCEVQRFDLGLYSELPEILDTTEVAREGIYSLDVDRWDHVEPDPLHDLLFVHRIRFDQEYSGAISHAAMLLKNYILYWLGFGSKLEIISISEEELLFDYSYLGVGMRHAVSSNSNVVVVSAWHRSETEFMIVNLKTSQVLWSEKFRSGNFLPAFDGDSLYVLCGPILHTYYFPSDSLCEKVSVRWFDEPLEKHPLSSNGSQITILNRYIDQQFGPIRFIADSLLYKQWHTWTYDAPDNRYWMGLSVQSLDGQLLIACHYDTVVTADYRTGRFGIHIIPEGIGTAPWDRIVPLTQDRFVVRSKNGDLSIIRWDLRKHN